MDLNKCAHAIEGWHHLQLVHLNEEEFCNSYTMAEIAEFCPNNYVVFCSIYETDLWFDSQKKVTLELKLT